MTVFIRAYIYLHNFIHLHFRYKSKHVQNINKFTNINTHIYKLCILLALTSSFSWQITTLPHIGLWGIKQKISPYSSRMKFQLAKRYAKRYTFFLPISWEESHHWGMWTGKSKAHQERPSESKILLWLLLSL